MKKQPKGENRFARLFPPHERVVVGRNPSFLNSLWLGLGVTLFWLPESLRQAINGPIKAILAGFGAIVVGFGAWVLSRVILVTLALAGLVTLSEES